MKKDFKPLKPGNVLFLALGLFLSACRSDQPPPKEICILDGYGAGECVEADGKRVRKFPSELETYWATNQKDMEAFAAWCYGTEAKNVRAAMHALKPEAKP